MNHSTLKTLVVDCDDRRGAGKKEALNSAFKWKADYSLTKLLYWCTEEAPKNNNTDKHC